MKKIILLVLIIISIGVFASFIDKQTDTLILVEKMKEDTTRFEDTVKFKSSKDSVQYVKNKELDQKLDELKGQQILLDSLIKAKQK